MISLLHPHWIKQLISEVHFLSQRLIQLYFRIHLECLVFLLIILKLSGIPVIN